MNATINTSFKLNQSTNNEMVSNSTIEEGICLLLSNGPEKDFGKEVKFIVLCIIILAALAGNGFVLRHLSKDRRRLSATNIFIASQCVTDIATSILVIPFAAASLLQGGWMLGKTFAVVNCFFNMFFTAVTLLNLAIIALDRYFAVVKLSHHLMKQRNAMCVVIGCWSTAFMTSFPWLPLLSDKVVTAYFKGFLTCGQRFSLYPPAYLEIGLFLFICALIIGFPLAIISFSFYSIGKKIRHNRCSAMPMTLSNIQTLQVDAYAKSAYTSYIVVLSSLLQVFPACTMMAIHGMQLARIPNGVATVAKMIMWSHCALKPIVYAARKNKFSFGKDRSRAYLRSFQQKSHSSQKRRSNAYIIDVFEVNSDVNEMMRQNKARKNIRKNQPISFRVLYSRNKTKKTGIHDTEFDGIITVVEI